MLCLYNPLELINKWYKECQIMCQNIWWVQFILHLLIMLKLNYLNSLDSYMKAYWFFLKTINGIHICLYIFLTVNNHKNLNNSITLFLFSPIVKSQWGSLLNFSKEIKNYFKTKNKTYLLTSFYLFFVLSLVK